MRVEDTRGVGARRVVLRVGTVRGLEVGREVGTERRGTVLVEEGRTVRGFGRVTGVTDRRAGALIAGALRAGVYFGVLLGV
ncbi:hypothetical protein HQ563_10095 [bacterium]|nr:hypothetical protein [bacterium]